ncbi:hypothetical protein [Rhodanobacter sp. Soil772]|uniref:hypothetical protein n=1 Tax=Rhodanobacter sp. Soil772 TaxID=1736406 RepID=UPI000B030FA2|nr:hypothetical protein [Rhodanobacter sp. Soil772]
MSRWTDQFKDHPFKGVWQSVKETSAQVILPDEAGISDAEELSRLRKLIVYLDAMLDGADPELISSDAFGGLHNGARAILGEIQAYISNKNIGHVRNANAQADALADLFHKYVGGPITQKTAAAAKAVAAAADSLSKYVSDWHNRTSQLVGRLDEQVKEVARHSVRANEAVDKLDQRLAALETQLQTQLAGFNTAFQTSESSRAERYDKWMEAQQSKVDEQFTLVAAKHATGLVVLGGYQDQAGKVLGSVVDTSQAGAYATYASEEKKNANTYRRLAISMMAVAALVLFLPEIGHFAQTLNGYTVDWQKALYRLPFSLILFAPAVYLARESSKHRNNEVVNRRRQHILTTIGPYLALLDVKKAEEIKAEVAKSIFADTLPIGGDKAGETGNVLAQISNLVTTLMKNR